MKKYFFEQVDYCEMCGSSTKAHKVLGQRLNQSQGFAPKKKEGISVSVKKCINCGLIYSSPQPIPSDIQDHYGIPPEEYWIPEEFIISDHYFLKEITKAKSFLNFERGMKALDVGAGLGKCMIALEKAGFEAFGMEPSIPFYNRALDAMKINPERLQLGTMEEVNFPENFFDFITYGAVFEHMYHPAKCLEKSMHWLKPGGVIQIEVPSSNWLIQKFINLYYQLRGTNYVTNLSPMHSPFHLYEFHLNSFKALGNKLGFDIVDYEYQACSVYFLPRFSHAFVKKLMKWTNTEMQLTVYLKKRTV